MQTTRRDIERFPLALASRCMFCDSANGEVRMMRGGEPVHVACLQKHVNTPMTTWNPMMKPDID